MKWNDFALLILIWIFFSFFSSSNCQSIISNGNKLIRKRTNGKCLLVFVRLEPEIRKYECLKNIFNCCFLTEIPKSNQKERFEMIIFCTNPFTVIKTITGARHQCNFGWNDHFSSSSSSFVRSVRIIGAQSYSEKRNNRTQQKSYPANHFNNFSRKIYNRKNKRFLIRKKSYSIFRCSSIGTIIIGWSCFNDFFK